MTPTEAQLAKLPKWARRELERLTADLAAMGERERARDAGETGVEVEGYAGVEGWHLDDRARVRWTLPYDARDGRPATVEVTRDRESVRISTSGGGLIVRPVVSNVVSIDVTRREP